MNIYIYIDVDAFFASVEQVINPALKGKPVIISGPPNTRSVVSTCSYEARKYGIHSAMASDLAYKLCPNGIFISGNMETYIKYSDIIMNILKKYTPKVEQRSIDEACLDMSGTSLLYSDYLEVANNIKKDILEKCGLTVSIGIGYNRLIAKMASDFNKPNGITFVKNGEEEAFIEKLPLNKIWGIGSSTLEKLKHFNIKSVSDLKEFSLEFLEKNFGLALGNYIFNIIRGKDIRKYDDNSGRKSISNEITLLKDCVDIEELKKILLKLSHQIMFRLIDNNQYSKTIFLKIKYNDFKSTIVHHTQSTYFLSAEEAYKRLLTLLNNKWIKDIPIRLLGAGFDNVSNKKQDEQLLFVEEDYCKQNKLEEVALSLLKKGYNIEKAAFLKQNDIDN